MTALIIIAAVAFLVVLGLGAALLFFLRQQFSAASVPPPVGQATPRPRKPLSFRWKYVALPLLFLLFSAAIVGYFYRLLPPEVAYHFRSDGTPDAWASRAAVITWTLVPEFLLTGVALAVAAGGARVVARLGLGSDSPVDLDRVLLAMGNMIGLPQAVLAFAMLRVFGYNAYQTHILPVWALVLAVVVLGAIALGIFFSRAFRQAGGRPR